MDVEAGLTAAQKNAGFVLPCVSRAEGTVVLAFNLALSRENPNSYTNIQPSGRLLKDGFTGLLSVIEEVT
jgi:hypothetical protein